MCIEVEFSFGNASDRRVGRTSASSHRARSQVPPRARTPTGDEDDDGSSDEIGLFLLLDLCPQRRRWRRQWLEFRRASPPLSSPTPAHVEGVGQGDGGRQGRRWGWWSSGLGAWRSAQVRAGESRRSWRKWRWLSSLELEKMAAVKGWGGEERGHRRHGVGSRRSSTAVAVAATTELRRDPTAPPWWAVGAGAVAGDGGGRGARESCRLV